MNKRLVQAGQFKLKRFRIFDFYDSSRWIEINKMIHGFEIEESILKGSVRGNATLFDTTGILHQFPLRGEERIEIEYEDFFEEKHKDRMILYAISNVKSPDNNNQAIWQYTIHFVSPAKLLSENTQIRRAYNSKISDSVQSIFDEFFASDSRKEIEIQPTDVEQRMIVPKYTPEQAMHFFARHAYNSMSFSQTFRFFESREKYFFATNEHLDSIGRGGQGYGAGLVDFGLASAVGMGNAPSIPYFGQIYEPDVSPEGQEMLMKSIIDISYPDIVNTVKDINEGAFSRATYELDYLNSAISRIEYNYKDEFRTNNTKQQLVHTNEFIEDNIDREKDYYALKDYSTEGMPQGEGVRPNTHYADIFNRKLSHYYHTKNNRVECTIYGRNTIFAGGLVDLKLIKHLANTDTIEYDDERSGVYLVESIVNSFTEDTYIQKLRLTRNGVGK